MQLGTTPSGIPSWAMAPLTILLSLVLPLSLAAAGGDWTLSETIESPSPAGAPAAVELADIDGDGVLDAVAVVREASAYHCYRGVGDGSFGEELASGSLYLAPSDLVVDDFDGDGRLDIAAINNACG